MLIIKPELELVLLHKVGISSLILNLTFTLLGYLITMNFLDLILELFDRLLSLKKRKKLSELFEITLNVFFLGIAIYSIFI